MCMLAGFPPAGAGRGGDLGLAALRPEEIQGCLQRRCTAGRPVFAPAVPVMGDSLRISLESSDLTSIPQSLSAGFLCHHYMYFYASWQLATPSACFGGKYRHLGSLNLKVDLRNLIM
jgi:hypothetical protein